MREKLHNWLNEIWYGGRKPPVWLSALVPVYRALNRLDRWWNLRQRPQALEQKCIVVVGNLTAGGSGKTPLVIRLCQAFKAAGLKPGVVSRGYGRQGRALTLVNPGSDPAVVGDEPLLISRRTGVPVVVAANRAEAAQTLFNKGVDLVISDDGLQHYRLAGSLELCVIDGSRGLGNGLLIPAGPLREPPSRLAEVDHVIVNGGLARPLKGIEAHRMDVVSGLLQSLDSGQSWRLSQFSGCSVNAVAGIANPDRFFELLEHARIKVLPHRFADHHAFEAGDFSGMDSGLPVVMTEKDAVKCGGLGLHNAWYLSVDAVVPAQWEQELINQVRKCVAGR
jgi:tetraacyldisaccharide 4'-kinase